MSHRSRLGKRSILSLIYQQQHQLKQILQPFNFIAWTFQLIWVIRGLYMGGITSKHLGFLLILSVSQSVS